jgi:hypothetical protein
MNTNRIIAFFACVIPLTLSAIADTSEGAAKNYFHGADLTKAPRTTDSRKLPDLWVERPKGSLSFEIRKDVKTVYSGLDGTVYQIPRRKCFYIQSDPLGSSTMTFFGPFPGDPTKVLKLEIKPISK